MKPFRLFIMFLVVSGITSLSYGQNATEAYPKEQNMNDRIFGLSKLWSEVKYNFVQIDRLGFDLDSLYMAYIPKVIDAENDIEYYNILQRFLASLNDGHTQFIIQYSWNSYYDYVPCVIKEFAGKYYITMIRKDSGIDPSFLYAEIVEIEGELPLQYITSNYFPDISASTYKSRLMQANIKLMQGPINSKLNGKAKKRDGEIVDFSFTRNGETTRSDKDTYIGIEEPPLYWYNLEWNDNIAICS